MERGVDFATLFVRMQNDAVVDEGADGVGSIKACLQVHQRLRKALHLPLVGFGNAGMQSGTVQRGLRHANGNVSFLTPCSAIRAFMVG
ncbi:MAG: hypothetical protein QM661_03965 [Solimonas sp.]